MMCDVSHFAPNDPIVYPGLPGASHMHSFYGNTSTDAFSTTASLLAGSSSCGRGMDKSDMSGYWVPSLYKTNTDGTSSLVTGGDQIIWAYYRRVGGPSGPKVQPFPAGLRMLAGNPKATSAQPQNDREVGLCSWWANVLIHSIVSERSGDSRQDLVPKLLGRCTPRQSRSQISYGIRSDRRNMSCRSPSLVARAVARTGLPRYSGGSNYSLSSGGVYSMHADFFNAWDSHVQNALIAGCLNNTHVCEDITREGNTLYKPAGNEFGPIPSIDITKY